MSTNDFVKDSASMPKKADIRELLRGQESSLEVLDEADGAMFTRISSNLEGEIEGMNTSLDEPIASQCDDVIIPVSVQPITAARPFPKFPDDRRGENLLLLNGHDETPVAIIISDDNINDDADGRILDIIRNGSNTNMNAEEIHDCDSDLSFVDHASFNRTSSSCSKLYKERVSGIEEQLDAPDCEQAAQKSNSNYETDSQNDTQNAETRHLGNGETSNDDGAKSKCRIVAKLFIPFASVVIYLADIGTDIQLADSYRQNGETTLFYATLTCIVAPSVIMAVVDLSWLWLDRRTNTAKKSRCALASRVIVGALSFGRIVRAFSHMYHLIKAVTGPDQKLHKKRALEEKRDCFMLDFINAFAESCPQLAVQMYLLYAYDLPLEAIRVVSLLSSWISIAWTYAAYYRCSREALSGRQDVNFFGFLLFFLSVLSALAARIICVVLFLIYFPKWLGLVFLAFHYFVMLIWIIWQKPKLEGTANSKFGRFMYELFFAYVSLMCFVNCKDTPAKYRIILFYTVVYVENIVMAGLVLWQLFSRDETLGKPWNLLALPIGFILHVVFLCLYYKCLHPKVGRYYQVALTSSSPTM